MSFIDAILLGFIQGITEFLPISSSGHLVIGSHFLGIINDNILFEVFVHLGTLGAILYFYRVDIFEMLSGVRNKEKKSLKYVLLIIIATIPAVVIGLLFNDLIKNMYNIYWVSIFLSITGVILMISKFSKSTSMKLTYSHALIIGLFQAVAILPGISRSGMTIGIALLLGVSKKNASKFSFFIAIPIIIGATLLELIKVENIFSIGLVNLAIGFVVAGISGYLSINWLIKLIDKSHFWKFSFYLWIVSFIIYYV